MKTRPLPLALGKCLLLALLAAGGFALFSSDAAPSPAFSSPLPGPEQTRPRGRAEPTAQGDPGSALPPVGPVVSSAPPLSLPPGEVQSYVWVTETVDSAGYVGGSPSLALDADGYPHISYMDDTNTNWNVKYAYYDGSSWHIEVVNPPGRTPGGTSLALDSTGRPHVAYSIYLSTGGAELRHAWYDGAAWQFEVVDGWSEGNSLALDAEDHPHISYSVRYAYFDGSTWRKQAVDSYGGSSFLALDSSDHPRLGYTGYVGPIPRVKYAYRDGSLWHVEEVTNPGRLGEVTSLVLDAMDRPYIGYFDMDTANGHAKYASYDGQSWHLHDLAPASDGPQLAVDAQGRLHASYSSPGHTLVYALYDGAAWQFEGVDPASDTWQNSLALDSSNRPHIAYYDGSLKYAYACAAVQAVTITGPARLPVGIEGLYEAALLPADASPPLTWAWAGGALGPTAAYSWTQTGSYSLAVTATNGCGQAHDDLTVTVFCQPLEGVDLAGPPVVVVGQGWRYQAAPQPLTASLPLTFTWGNGMVGAAAVYSWTVTGTYTVSVSATNVCGEVREAALPVRVLAEWPEHLYLPVVIR